MADPPAPLRLIFDGRYDYIGFWRYEAHCWLRVYVLERAGDLPVVIVTEMPDNECASITNFAEKLAWKVIHDVDLWTQAPGAARGCHRDRALP